jgi:thiol-disulfide isomerase/thioredoxin
MNRFYFTTFFAILISSIVENTDAQTAPDFTITTTGGQTVSLYDDYLDQGKAVMLKIMFTSCPPCNSIAPLMEPLYQDWGGGNGDVEFIELSDKSFDDNSDMAAYAAQYGITYPGAGSDGGSLSAVAPYKNGTFGQFFGTPTFVVISPNGNVQYDVSGSGNQATIDSISAAIQRALDEMPVEIDTTYTFSGRIMFGPPNNPLGVEGVTFMLDLPNDTGEIPLTGETGSNGTFFFEHTGVLPAGTTLTPMMDAETIEGVTTFDLLLMMRRILGLDPYLNDLQRIQADVNNDGVVNIIDVTEMRKLILGIYEDFPGSTALKFGTTQPVLDENSNEVPLSPSIIVRDGETDYSADFYMIKTGDLNNSYNY